MAGSDISAWRRQNSDAVLVEIVLADGTLITGNIMKPRDKTVRETISMPEPFIEVECQVNGNMLLSKAQLRYVRPIELAKADQLDVQLRNLEKLDVFNVLKIKKGAALNEVREAASALRQLYDPAKLEGTGTPPELLEYLAAVRKRVDAAEAELIKALTPVAAKVTANPALQRRPAA